MKRLILFCLLSAVAIAAPRKLPTTYTKFPLNLSVLGDSHTLNYAYDVRQTEFYGDVLAGLVEDEIGRPVRCVNFGISGDTTYVTTTGGTWTTASAGMVNRLGAITNRTSVPSLVVIYDSSNDYTCISSGGAFPDFPGVTTANVSTNVTRVGVKLLLDGLVAMGVDRIVVCGYHPLNWATGGDVDTVGVDFIATPSLASDPGAVFGKSSRWANYVAVTEWQAANPSASTKVLWCDLFAGFKTIMESEHAAEIGTDSYYHVGTSNTHLNTVGQALLARVVFEAIETSRPTWLTSMEVE
jgi:hypothetical protein